MNSSDQRRLLRAGRYIQITGFRTWPMDQMRVRFPYGIVIYAGQQVRRVDYTDASRTWLAEVIDEVRKARMLPIVIRNHHISGRCSGCGLRPHCNQSLI